MVKICSVAGCGRKFLARGFCSKHYGQLPDRKAQDARYYAANKDKLRPVRAAWAAANAEYISAKAAARYRENKETYRKNGAAWAAANPERMRELQIRWEAENTARRREIERTYFAKYPDQKQVKTNKRRATKRAADGKYTRDDVAALRQAQPVCQCCGGSERLTVDHIFPLARGGSNWPWNLQILCARCNSKKNDLKVEAWRNGELIFWVAS